ncbi:hypothetical protein N9Y42_00595 [Mariniblastus sp.]|nr:hypothetical protein [Mariniblastus sp.]
MLLQIILAYVVISQAILFYCVWSSLRSGCVSMDSYCDISTFSSFQKFRLYAFMGLLGLVAAPIALPVIAFSCAKLYRQETKEIKEKYGHHVEKSLDPLHPFNMPSDLADYIEEHQPAAIAMNFELLGDYWLKGKPYHSKARIFISDDRTSFAEIGVVLGVYYCEMNSYLEDGSIVGTGNIKPVKGWHSREEHGWYVNLIGELDMLQTIEAHSKFLEEVAQQRGQAIKKISRENWKDYCHYSTQEYGHMRFKLGEIKEPPASNKIPWESNETTQQANLVETN